VSTYILHFRNQILVKSMQKVFWQFPTAFDPQERWARLDAKVKKQVLWIYNPIRVDVFAKGLERHLSILLHDAYQSSTKEERIALYAISGNENNFSMTEEGVGEYLVAKF